MRYMKYIIAQQDTLIISENQRAAIRELNNLGPSIKDRIVYDVEDATFINADSWLKSRKGVPKMENPPPPPEKKKKPYLLVSELKRDSYYRCNLSGDKVLFVGIHNTGFPIKDRIYNGKEYTDVHDNQLSEL